MRTAVATIAAAFLLLPTPARAASWKSEGPYFGNVTAMIVDPANPDRLWVSTHGGGVWRSADGGNSWQLSGKELSDRVVTYIALQPKSNVLWAGVGGGSLARSKDGGQTWEWVRDDLAQEPFPPAFDRAGGIWIADVNLHKRSSDGGAQWTDFRVAGGDVRVFAFHPRDPQIIWAGGVNRRAGLWKSNDGGASWKQLGLGLPEMNNVQRLVIDPSQPETLYMVVRRGAFKSADGGENWTPIGGLIQDAEIEGFTLHPSTPQTIFAGTSKGFLRSTDAGQSWTRIAGGIPRFVVSAVVFHPASPDVMWVGTAGAGIYKSIDGGRSWTETNRGFAASWIQTVWGDATGTMFVQTGRGLFRSDGKGAWTEVVQPFSDHEARVDVVVFDARMPRMVHAGLTSRYYRSSDAGETWTQIVKPFQDPSPEFNHLVIDPKNPKVLYSADRHPTSGDPLVFKSTDGGVRWVPAQRGITASSGIAALSAASTGMLFALGSEGGLWRSVDGAASWAAAGTGLPTKDLKALAIDPTSPTRVYVVAEDGFYRSEDGGVNFSAQTMEPESVAVDAKGNVYVASFEGVSRSTDGGKTWTAFNDGLTNTDVRSLSAAGTRLYAGTAGGGVFWIDIVD